MPWALQCVHLNRITQTHPSIASSKIPKKKKRDKKNRVPGVLEIHFFSKLPQRSGHGLALWWSSYLVCKNLPHKTANLRGHEACHFARVESEMKCLPKLTEDLMFDLTEVRLMNLKKKKRDLPTPLLLQKPKKLEKTWGESAILLMDNWLVVEPTHWKIIVKLGIFPIWNHQARKYLANQKLKKSLHSKISPWIFLHQPTPGTQRYLRRIAARWYS